jgi:hypothetical protein
LFVQGILSNVFRKSDFVTNFAITGVMFILTRSSCGSPWYGYIKNVIYQGKELKQND